MRVTSSDGTRSARRHPAPAESATWLLIGENGDAVAAADRGADRSVASSTGSSGLPASDADEQELTAALRAAAEESPALRIVDFAAIESDTVPSQRSLSAGAAPGPGRHPAALPRRRGRRAAGPDLGDHPWRATCYRHRHGVARADGAVGIRPCRISGVAAAVGWTGRPGRRHRRRVVAGDQPGRRPNRAARTSSRFAARTSTCPGWPGGSGQPSAAPLVLRDDATYLVTGGLGSIGLEIAGYLAAQWRQAPGADQPPLAERGRADSVSTR